ncbi:hypothetical protein ACWF95_41505, partial [Streptomyces vinaceus]
RPPQSPDQPEQTHVNRQSRPHSGDSPLKTLTEGKTDREIRRCLKRYLARRIYRHLNHAATTSAPGVDET